MFISVDNCRFRHPVRPGDVLRMPVEVLRAQRRRVQVQGAWTGRRQGRRRGRVRRHAGRDSPGMSIHPTALVAPGAELAADVEIGPYCTVGASVKLASGVALRSHVVIEGADRDRRGLRDLSVRHAGRAAAARRPQAGDPLPPRDRRAQPDPRARDHERRLEPSAAASPRSATTAPSTSARTSAMTAIVGDHVTLTNAATLGGHVKLGDYVIMGGLRRSSSAGASAATPSSAAPRA